MSMEVANQILREIRISKTHQKTAASSMSSRTLRPLSGRPTPPPGQPPYGPPPVQEQPAQSSIDQRKSYGQDPSYDQPPRVQPHGSSSAASLEAAKASYNTPSQPPAPQQRPAPAARTASSQSAAAAAAAALSGKRAPSQRGPAAYQRSSTDYTAGPGSRTSAGYAPSMDPHPERDSGYGQGRPVQQPTQQSTYDPAAYAAVSGYPPPAQIQQQPLQQPQPQSQLQQQAVKQSYPAPAVQQASSPHQQVVERKEALPQGTGKRIGLDHFNFLAVLGKGNFGKVMLAETKSSKQLYAIKVLKKEFIIENDEVESTRSEKRVFLIANKERHPFLLNLHACFQTETRVYFVMEYISGGDLMLHIQRGQFGTKRAQYVIYCLGE